MEWYLRSADDLRRQYSQYQIPFEFSLLKDLTVASVALAKYAMTMVLTAYDRLKELQEQGDPRAPKAQVNLPLFPLPPSLASRSPRFPLSRDLLAVFLPLARSTFSRLLVRIVAI